MTKKFSVGAGLIWLKKLDWSYLLIWFLAILAAVFLQIFRLSSLTNHSLAAAEKSTLAASNSWHNLVTNPLFLPYKFLEWIILKVGGYHVFTARLTSVIFALIGLWLFLGICRRWFNKPTYIFATVLFGSSLWQLHFGRLALPTILLTVTPLAIIRVALWIREIKAASANKYLVAAVITVVLALTLYVPGAWLMWLVVAVWQRKKLLLLAKKLPNLALLGGLALFFVLISPLIYGLTLAPALVEPWLGYVSTSGGIMEILRLFVDWPVYLLGYGPHLPAYAWLGRQPLMGIFSAVMALVGVYFYVRNYKLRQAKLLGLILAVALVLFVLSNRALLGLTSGVAFLMAAAGIGYLLKIWKRVFPRNPFAYGVAVFLLGLAVILAVAYTTRSYYIAWRYHPEVQQYFKG